MTEMEENVNSAAETSAAFSAAALAAVEPAASSPAPPAASPAAISLTPDPPTQLQLPHTWTGLETLEDDGDSALGEDIASSTASITSSILKFRVLNGRTYHHELGENHYWAPNDDRQNNTLDIGHHTYTLLMGGKLFLAPLPEHIDKAVDIGTGSGIWAIEIEDFNEPWTFGDNSVDYVHLRWLVGCVQDWTQLFKNAYRILKPGGYIESLEVDGSLDSDDGTVTKKTALSQWGQIFQEGARKLGSLASFNPVPFSEWSEDPVLHEVGQFTRAAIFNDIEGLVSVMATQLGWTPEEITVYAAHLRREMRGLNVHAYMHGCVAYAQKPLDA
ncbi:hypothetical protein CMQ_7626 [Grosmannia clavigera kw1407]|uniref:Uncharacterized protein n=1 Tax=Grosmannia clavigera (strain kw1407 / UAMH 11150) TaxID=655863 RepID=F0XNK2_GROCL|nr:uncharacterized protein CMQ_7626 [Grosmannia clavigera kw1407]EFX00624.1 hypothetical protein CMQ_7626 [Grosmannia clavigera kw1407]